MHSGKKRKKKRKNNLKPHPCFEESLNMDRKKKQKNKTKQNKKPHSLIVSVL